MNWIECKSAEQANLAGLGVLVTTVRANPDAHLVLATGASPTGLYAAFAAQNVECSELRITCLDEWWGLPEWSDGTCAAYLRDHVIVPWGCDPQKFLRYETGRSTAEDARDHFEAEYENRGKPDLCVLGIGKNGHIGLNEPSSEFLHGVNVVELEPITRQHQMVSNLEEPPSQGITLGCDNLFDSRLVLIFADNGQKQEALSHLRTGPTSPSWPTGSSQSNRGYLGVLSIFQTPGIRNATAKALTSSGPTKGTKPEMRAAFMLPT